MIESTEFSELVLTWDSREQSNSESRTRVTRIIKWFEDRGGTMIQQMALPLCDYHIGGGYDEATKTFLSGTFRGKEINLGIEYKTMTDYGNSGKDLDWKLIDAYRYYDQVALFVEEGNIGLSFVDGKTYIKNPAIPDGKADVTVYEHYKNEIDRFSQIADIHIRTFQYESFIDVNLDSLMILLSEAPKVRLYCRGDGKDDPRAAFVTALLAIPKIGVKTALKFADVYPNLEIFSEHAKYIGEFEKIAGNLTGKRIRDFVCGRTRANKCFANYREMFPLPQPPQPIHTIQCPYNNNKGIPVNCDQVNAYQCIGDTCRHHPSFKLSQHSVISQHSSHLGTCPISEPTLSTIPIVSGDSEVVTSSQQATSSFSHGGDKPFLKPLSKETKLTLPDTSSHGNDETVPSLRSSLPDKLQSSDNTKAESLIQTKDSRSSTAGKSRPMSSGNTSKENVPSGDTSSHPLPELFSKPPPEIQSGSGDQQGISTPPADFSDKVITSLNDAIVDFCYDKPKSDTEIMSAFQYRGFKMPEIHKTLIALGKTKLHKYKDGGKTMFGYKGVKATPELDVGV